MAGWLIYESESFVNDEVTSLFVRYTHTLWPAVSHVVLPIFLALFLDVLGGNYVYKWVRQSRYLKKLGEADLDAVAREFVYVLCTLLTMVILGFFEAFVEPLIANINTEICYYNPGACNPAGTMWQQALSKNWFKEEHPDLMLDLVHGVIVVAIFLRWWMKLSGTKDIWSATKHRTGMIWTFVLLVLSQYLLVVFVQVSRPPR